MKGLMFLGLVGAVIYGALLLSYDVLPRETAEDAFAGRSLGDPGGRQLRSWGTDLPALASSQDASLPLRKPSVTPASTSNAGSNGASLPMSEAKPTSAQSDSTTYQPVEWAKVVIAAKVHGDASVSSPILRFYQPGTALRVVSRQNGWIEVADPSSGEAGWVFEQYLAPADGPTATQTAMATVPTKVTAAPAQATTPPAAKKRVVRAPRPAARMPDDFASTQFDQRWGRRAERRSGFGMFFFGRFARNDAEFR
jgi:Bacterial SH3 domain